MGGGIRKQGKMPRLLDGQGQGALVLGAGAGATPRLNLAPVRDVTAQLGGVLIVNCFGLISAKGTELALRLELPATLPFLIF